MPNYRRTYVPGGTYFFTVNLAERGDWLLFDQLDDLKSAWRSVAADRPFHTVEAVILPDHIHTIWTLPEGDSDYARRWMMIKARFSRQCEARPVRASLARKAKRASGSGGSGSTPSVTTRISRCTGVTSGTIR